MAKIEAIRGRARERTQRFMNSRLRTLGVDKAYLDKQVNEKLQSKLIEEQKERQEGKFHQTCTYVNPLSNIFTHDS